MPVSSSYVSAMNSEIKQTWLVERNVKNVHISQWDSSFARLARASFIFVHFAVFLALTTTWNDLFCCSVDDVNIRQLILWIVNKVHAKQVAEMRFPNLMIWEYFLSHYSLWMSVEKALRYVNLLLSQFPHNEVAFKSQRTVVSSYKSIPESKSCGFSPTPQNDWRSLQPDLTEFIIITQVFCFSWLVFPAIGWVAFWLCFMRFSWLKCILFTWSTPRTWCNVYRCWYWFNMYLAHHTFSIGPFWKLIWNI